MKYIFLLILIFIYADLYSQTQHTSTIHRDIDWTNTSEELTTTNDLNADTVHSDVQQTDFIVGNGTNYKIIFGDSLVLVSYTASGDSSMVILDSNGVSMAFYEDGKPRSITIDTNGIIVRDNADGVGMRFSEDYTYINREDNTTLTSKNYQDTHLGGQTLYTNILDPPDDYNNAVLVWDTSGVFKLLPAVPFWKVRGVRHEPIDSIVFSNTSVDTLELDLETGRGVQALPVGTKIPEILVYVKTGFNGTGTDLLDVGIDSDGDKYENNLDISASDTWHTLTNLPDRLSESSYITFQYFDQNTDATAGEAYIYVSYSIH